MSEELIKSLRMVVKEELELTKKDLKEEIGLNIRGELELTKKDLKQELGLNIKEELEPIRKDLAEIKLGQRQLSKDIAASLGQYTNKYEKYVDSKTEALNKRVYKLESEMEQMTRR